MSRKLRIVHCFRSPVGGIFRHVRDLADAQLAAGHEVGIVCDSSTGGEHEERLFAEIEPKLTLGVRRTAMQRHVGIGDIGAAWRAHRLVSELKPDILHGHGAKGGAYARLFGSLFRASRSRVARIYSPHGGSLHYDADTATGKIFFLAEGLLGRLTDQFLFVSDYERRSYEAKIGKPRAPARLVHNGLRAEEFKRVNDAPNAADFLYIGMMRDLKGPDLFIEALATASQTLGRKLSAVMVGDGDDKPGYEARARELADRIDVAFRPAMPAREAFRLGRIMVVPSRAEAMPYIVLEALAAGRPMIASAVGGIPEVFGTDSPVLVTPDIDAIAGHMVTAIGDVAAYRAKMPPQKELKARFSAAVMARSIESAYLETLKRIS
ncbi:MAG: glycosyltransferase family 4 protein [Rhizobiaceae bacterium]|nr:glycosyltransferase family 4 protein [Rhizobiaceae bacterium]